MNCKFCGTLQLVPSWLHITNEHWYWISRQEQFL